MSNFKRFISQKVIRIDGEWNLWEFVWETVDGQKKKERSWRMSDMTELYWGGGDVVGMALEYDGKKVEAKGLTVDLFPYERVFAMRYESRVNRVTYENDKEETSC